MKNIHYALDGDQFVLYQDGAPLTTPHGVVITTTNEELAQKLVEELQVHHYRYCLKVHH
jgi:hypothetical protein